MFKNEVTGLPSMLIDHRMADLKIQIMQFMAGEIYGTI